MLRRAAHVAIRAYQLTLSSLIGRQCRHWPSCSTYTDTAIQRHGLWAGGWIGVSRICRCGPFGTHGIDLVPEALPPRAVWFTPWRYGRWRGVEAPPSPFVCDAPEPPIRLPDDSLESRIGKPARRLSEAEIRIAKRSTGCRTPSKS